MSPPLSHTWRGHRREPRSETAKAAVASTETRLIDVPRPSRMATERPPGREVRASGKRATPGNGNAVPRPLSDVSSLTVRRLDGPERLPSQRGRRQRTHEGDRSECSSRTRRRGKGSRRARSAETQNSTRLPVALAAKGAVEKRNFVGEHAGPDGPLVGRRCARAFLDESYLVDPASSHMLVSKIKPCMCKYRLYNGETANGSLDQLWFLRSYNPTWITVAILELIHADNVRPSREDCFY
jgi:hypothetical protein